MLRLVLGAIRRRRTQAILSVALAGVDLAVAPGETLALVDPSGSGKST